MTMFISEADMVSCPACGHHGPWPGDKARELCGIRTAEMMREEAEPCRCTDAAHSTFRNARACDGCGATYEGGRSSLCFECAYAAMIKGGENEAAPMIATLRDARIDATIDQTGGGCMSVAFNVEGCRVWVSGIDPAVGGGASLWFADDDYSIGVTPAEAFGGEEEYEQWHAPDGALQRRWAQYVIANVGAWVAAALPLRGKAWNADDSRVTLANGDLVEMIG